MLKRDVEKFFGLQFPITALVAFFSLACLLVVWIVIRDWHAATRLEQMLRASLIACSLLMCALLLVVYRKLASAHAQFWRSDPSEKTTIKHRIMLAIAMIGVACTQATAMYYAFTFAQRIGGKEPRPATSSILLSAVFELLGMSPYFIICGICRLIARGDARETNQIKPRRD